MAQVKITDLPNAQALTGSEAVPIVQNGVTVQTSTGSIASVPNQQYTFLTATQQSGLANSRYLAVGSGLSITDNGAQSTLSISLTGSVPSLNSVGNGLVAKTATDTLTARQITVGNGLAITNGDGVAANPQINLGSYLTSFQSTSSSTGILGVSGGAFTSRAIVGTTGNIGVTNGDASTGNPTINLIATGTSTGTFGSTTAIPVVTVDAYGRITSISTASAIAGGTVTEIDTGTGLTGGPITSSGTISLANTAVTAGTYGSATQVGIFTVNAQGQLTAASNTTVTPAWSSITSTPTTIAGYGITDAVSLAGSQTLTNKTISGASNTLTNIGNGSLTNSTITINGNVTSLGGSVSVGTVTSVAGTGSVNGITLTGSVTASGSLTLGGALSGIGNSQLTNSSITINGNSVSLGGSTTVTASTTSTLTIGTGLSGTSFNGSAPVTIAIANTGVSAGTYGTATAIPSITVNAQGQITSISTNPLNSPAYQGTWNASTNSPTLTSSVGTNNNYYVVSTAGTTTLNGISLWSVGDWAIFNGTTNAWEKINGSSTEAFTGITVTGLTGYMYANGSSAVTASTTIPSTAITGLGTMSTQNANSVAITGGTINGASIGATTRSSGDFTTLSANSVTSTTPVLSFNASNSIASFGSTTANSYNQLVIQNKSTSAFASTNYVISNDIGTDSSYYGEFGMNSSTFSASTPSDFYSINNGVYFSGHDGDITFGSGNGYKSYFAWGSTGQYAHVINSSGALGFSTNLGTTPALSGTTGYGTSGQALVTGGSAAAPAWGVVGINGGGTNGTATPTAGAIAYGTGTAYAFSAAGSTGQVLTSNGSGTPTWATPASSISLSDDTTTNATRYPLFANATSGTVSTEYTSSTKYQYNPSTGVLTATGFSGSGAALTSLTAGNLTGTIPSGVLGNSTVYIGTTAIALNRASASQTLTGTSIDGNAGTATTATTATNATNTAVTDDTSTNATFYPTFVSNTTGNLPQTVSSTKFKYNPSTGTTTSTIVQSGTQANYIQSTGAATTFEPTITAAGSDTNVALAIKTQGTGAIDLAAGSSGVNISNGGTVTALTVTAGGGSYTSIPTPTITVPTTSGGVQATASCNMLLANTPTVTSGGTGYSVNDVLTISGGTFSVVGQLTVTAVSGGVITAATILAYGTYTVLPSSPVSVTGGTGTGATFTVTWGVRSLNITAAGSGYVEQPTVSFSGGGGSGAAAYVTVGSIPTVKSVGSAISFATPGGEGLRLSDSGGTTTNYWSFSGGNGGDLTVQYFGGSGNIGATFVTRGTGSHKFSTNASSGNQQFAVTHTASAVNYVQVTGAATTVSPKISSQGSDTNIDLTLTPKGTGVVRGQGVAVSSENGIFLSKQTVATSMTVAAGYSAMSSGPITVASGVTVTLSSGSRWVIL